MTLSGNRLCSFLEGVVRRGISEGLHLGAQIYVSQGGRVLCDEAFGEAQPGVALAPDAAMFWMSSGKPLTALGVALLVERGLLDLHDRVSAHWPEFGQGGKGAITIEHLLTHTGGFRSADYQGGVLDLRDVLGFICAAPLEPQWVPGAKAGYHLFSSWYVLAELIHRASGMPAEQFLRRHLLEPAGLDEVGLFGGELPAGRSRSGLYATASATPVPHPQLMDPRFGMCFRPGSGIMGSARELGRFYEVLLGGLLDHRIPGLSPATLRHWTGRRRVGLHDASFRHALDWGYGFIPNNRHLGERVPYGYGPHASASAFGHSGNQSSVGFADPERDMAVAMLFNGQPGEPRHQARMQTCLAGLGEE